MKKMYRGFEFEDARNGEVYLLMPDGTKKRYSSRGCLFYAIEDDYEDMLQEHIVMKIKEHKTNDLHKATRIAKSSISRWKSGMMMTAPVLAMFKFYFELEEMKAQQKTLIEALEIKSANNS